MARPAHLDETIAVFELLDEQPELEAQGVSPAELMKGNTLPEGYDEWLPESDISAEEIQQSGGELLYQHEAGALWGDYSPDASLADGDIIHVGLHYDHEQFGGDVVEDAHVKIVRATPAPYLDRGKDPEQAVGEASIGMLDVPADYDQDALEQSVATAVARLNAAAGLQDVFAETAAQYAEELADGAAYQP